MAVDRHYSLTSSPRSEWASSRTVSPCCIRPCAGGWGTARRCCVALTSGAMAAAAATSAAGTGCCWNTWLRFHRRSRRSGSPAVCCRSSIRRASGTAFLNSSCWERAECSSPSPVSQSISWLCCCDGRARCWKRRTRPAA